MQLTTFPSYREYLKQQRRSDRRKSRRSSATDREMQLIAQWYTLNSIPAPKKGVCHGARHGDEIRHFEKYWKECAILGTDLFAHEGQHPNLLQWDFHNQNAEWLGHFDFVYSNALDHAHSPETAIEAWFNQLSSDGHLLLQWCTYHMGVTGGDCFGATMHEYVALLEKFGRMRGIIYVGHPTMVVLVARKKGKDRW